MAGKKRKKGIDILQMIAISGIVLVLLSFMLIRSQDLKAKNSEYERRVQTLEEQIERESERTEEIANLQSEVQTQEYAGEIARERLGLVGDGEIIFRAEN